MRTGSNAEHSEVRLDFQMSDKHRYVPERPLPSYAHVPGETPHPLSDPQGHSFNSDQSVPMLIHEDNWQQSKDYLFGIDLFNHGYYWEAHETWEGLWHVAGRSGPIADFLKGLIQLAVTGVKIKQGLKDVAQRKQSRAIELIQQARDAIEEDHFLGFSLERLLSEISLSIETIALSPEVE